MTYEQRERIFSKEILTADDISALYECDRQKAYSIIRKIKKGSIDRLNEQGKVHVADYIDYFKLGSPDRYGKKIDEREMDKLTW